MVASAAPPWMVNAAPQFKDHPTVINGCSDLLVSVFGDRGRHARSAAGMSSLPFDTTVDLDDHLDFIRRSRSG